jgi:hypothetical protein
VPDDDAKLNALALDLCGRATVNQIRDDAAELGELLRERPIPPLPDDPALRASLLLVELLRERDRCRRLLAWVERAI